MMISKKGLSNMICDMIIENGVPITKDMSRVYTCAHKICDRQATYITGLVIPHFWLCDRNPIVFHKAAKMVLEAYMRCQTKDKQFWESIGIDPDRWN